MTRARIMKHSGAVAKASEAMNNAREMDLKDRYINTKCAKYQLRNNEHETAVSTMGLFTRKEAVGGPLGDLTDMQCVWFLTEDGESYLRQGKLSLALKRFKTVYEIFETWTDDQFDFHSFSLRKGMVRAYVDMIRWEDKLRDHPFFTRAALSAIRIYCALHDRPQLVQEAQTNGANGLSAAEKKKAAKKARKEEERKETERKAAKAKQPTPKAEDEDAAKKEDTDPEGVQLLETKTPLDEAMKYVTPLVELSPKSIEGQAAAFEVYIRRSKLPPSSTIRKMMLTYLQKSTSLRSDVYSPSSLSTHSTSKSTSSAPASNSPWTQHQKRYPRRRKRSWTLPSSAIYLPNPLMRRTLSLLLTTRIPPLMSMPQLKYDRPRTRRMRRRRVRVRMNYWRRSSWRTLHLKMLLRD